MSVNIKIKNHRGFIGLVLLAIGETIVWAGLFYIFPALLLRWENGFDWSRIELTGAVTLALLVSAVCSPFVGRFIDGGIGPKLMAGGALVGGVCVYLLSFSNALWQFYLLWAVIGAAFSACLYEPCFILITRAYGEEAKKGIILVTLVAGFASTVSFPMAHIIAEQWGWSMVTRCFAIVVLAAGVPILYVGAAIVERDGHGIVKRRRDQPRAIVFLHNPVFCFMAIAFALLALVHGATLHHLLPILSDRDLAIGSAVLVASLIGPMQVVGRLIITALSNRLSHKLTAYSCFLFVGIAIVLLYFSKFGFSVAVTFALVFGSGYGVVSIIRPVIARDLLGDQHFGAKSGFLAFFYLIGSAAAPYTGSLIWAIGSYDLVLFVLWLLTFAGFGFMHKAIIGHGRKQ